MNYSLSTIEPHFPEFLPEKNLEIPVMFAYDLFPAGTIRIPNRNQNSFSFLVVITGTQTCN